MTTLDSDLAPALATPQWASAMRAFRALLWRDIFVTGRQLGILLIQVGLTPLFTLFIFGKVLGSLKYVSAGFGELLLAGIVALTAFLTALQSVAFPLATEFGWTKEIEDRLLAPLSTTLVAVEKLVMAMLRGLFAAAIILPVSGLVLGTTPWRAGGAPLLVAVLVLGSWVGGAIGITLGTLVNPTRINVMFALILTPLMFTGCIQYPLVRLDHIRWFQTISALNPLSYCAEGARAALAPHTPHLDPAVSVSALVGYAVLFTATGILGFRRRAIR
jgi:ABC-2 type transport system permease protein